MTTGRSTTTTGRAGRRRAVLTALLLLAASTTACGSAPAAPHEPGALALVIGGRGNMPQPQLIAKARKMAGDALLSGDTFFVVGVSGDPQTLYTDELKSACDSETACDGAVEDFTATVDSLVSQVKATTPEADTLGAILMAAKQVAAVDKGGPKRIVVVDSALQTAGDVPLQAPGALGVPVDALVNQLGDKLKPLAGLNILLSGIGSAAGAQPRISADDRGKLEALWTKLLTAAGAKVDLDSTQLADVAPADDLPKITPVNFAKATEPAAPGCFTIRDDQVGFVPDKADFREPALAREVLTPIADELKRSRLTATVVGTTALEEAPPYPLSSSRARSVVDLLVDLGVPGSALTAVGVGTQFAGFVPDTDGDGRLIETLAVQNRLVFVQPVGQKCQ